MSTIKKSQTLWFVFLGVAVEKQLESVPPQTRSKFDRWVIAVTGLGPWLKGGWRTEALAGVLKGFYSVRLNRKWRIIFEVRPERRVVVIGIIAHDYKTFARRI